MGFIMKSIFETTGLGQTDVEHPILLPDESIRWILMTGAVIRNENGIPVRMIGMIRNITERRESAEKINASLKEKEVLLKEIHDRGLRLVTILEKQLNGTLTYSGNGGACFVLTFNEPLSSEINY
jgi:hypothetical protein